MTAVVAKTGSWTLEIVKRNELHRFVVLPKRWVVERTLVWISCCHRLAKDFERHARKAVAFIRSAMIRLMLRRLTAPSSGIETSRPASTPPGVASLSIWRARKRA